jgi:hypothetical protein
MLLEELREDVVEEFNTGEFVLEDNAGSRANEDKVVILVAELEADPDAR